MRMSDGSSDVCSSDLIYDELIAPITMRGLIEQGRLLNFRVFAPAHPDLSGVSVTGGDYNGKQLGDKMNDNALVADIVTTWAKLGEGRPTLRSEEHTSELQSLMRISYAVLCLKKKKHT